MPLLKEPGEGRLEYMLSTRRAFGLSLEQRVKRAAVRQLVEGMGELGEKLCRDNRESDIVRDFASAVPSAVAHHI